MKKSTILSFATAAAIVATSAGTYAVWDTLDATNGGTLTLEHPVALSSTPTTSYTTAAVGLSETAPTYSGDVIFNVKNESDKTISKLKITKVAVYESTDTSKTSDLASGFDIDITGATGNDNVTATGATATDTSVVKGENKYTVSLTPKDDTNAGKTLTVDVTAKIE